MREEDAETHPYVAALIDPMASLRADALHAVLGASDTARRRRAPRRARLVARAPRRALALRAARA